MNSLVLQARMFSYPDAASYRVGKNYQMLSTIGQSPMSTPLTNATAS